MKSKCRPFFLEITVILGEKSNRRDQSSFSFLENINFWKFLSRAPEFEYPPLPLLSRSLVKNLMWDQKENYFFAMHL